MSQQNYKNSLDKLKAQLAGIDSKYSNNEAFEAYKAELNSAGRISGRLTGKQRGAARKPKNSSTGSKVISKKVEHYLRFVSMLQVVPNFDKEIDCHQVKYFLYRHLQSAGFDIILNEFMYQRSVMDTFAIQYNRAVEFEIKLSREDYLNDFGKLYYMGPTPLNKHSVLAAGQSMVSKFYFVVPENMIDIRECPKHCGLIWFKVVQLKKANTTRKLKNATKGYGKGQKPRNGTVIVFRVVKYPPQLHNTFIPANTYQTICKRLYARMQYLVDKYTDSMFFKSHIQAITNEPPTGSIPAPTTGSTETSENQGKGSKA